MADVAEGQTVGHGVGISGGDAGYHVLHRLVVAVGRIVGESAYDESAQGAEHSAEAEIVEYALHLVDRFGDVLYE